ncbi:MAG: alpha/beta hydrolase [Burkholderiaceae bacterium]|jgi:hypothetical protein|nr:alpha/beta hydrolase [Burkholderiaceae bacterium]
MAARADAPDPARRLWLRAAAVLAATPLLPGCTMVESMFFYPDRVGYTRPADLGLAHQDLFFDSQGARLHGWWLPAATQPAQGSVLHVHGNAANISNHLPLVAWLPPAGFNVLMFDYRGFGQSDGRPTLAGIVDDAAAALATLRRQPGVDVQRLIVFGQSLGGATALRLLARDAKGVRLVIIDSAFASYRGIAREAALDSVVLAPLLPMALPMLPPASDDPVTALATIRTPLLFLHGTRDSVVRASHSDTLYAAAHEPKRLLKVDGAVHMEAAMRPNVQRELLATMRDAMTG